MEVQSTLLIHWVGPCCLGTELSHPLVQNTSFLDHPPDLWKIPFPGRGTVSMLVLPISAVDLTPSKSARKTWFPRSPGFPFAPTHIRTDLFHLIFDFFLFFFIFLSGLNVLFFYLGLVLCKASFRDTCAGTFAALPDAPELPDTPHPISYDSHPFSLGHPHPVHARYHVPMLCSLYLGKTTYL